jgi:hypothetical protein
MMVPPTVISGSAAFVLCVGKISGLGIDVGGLFCFEMASSELQSFLGGLGRHGNNL